MRGFLSFLLLFGIACVMITSFGAYSELRAGEGKAGILELEKKYYLEQDYKRAMLESAKLAAREADGAYDLICNAPGAGGRPECKAGKGTFVAAAVWRKLVEFEKYAEKNGEEAGWEVDLWCGDVDSKPVEEVLAAMVAGERAEKCEGCEDIDSLKCASLIAYDENERKVSLGRGWVGFGGGEIFGFSFYNQRLGVASVAYIPRGASEVRL